MPAVKKAKANKPKISESQLQASFFTWFRLQYPQYYWHMWAVPNGGLRNKIVAARLKKEGALSGVLDCFFSLPKRTYGGMFIEFKVGYNGLTDNQKEFIERHEQHYIINVCRTLDEAIEAVTEYLTM